MTTETNATPVTTETTPEVAPVAKPGLETEVCSRCGGSGHYSYCSAYGTTCFKCAGRKMFYSKRGIAAKHHLTALRSRKVSELVTGDKIIQTNLNGQRTSYTIVAIEPHDMAKDGGVVGITEERLTITCKTIRFVQVQPDSTYEVLLSPEEQARTLQEAIAFQATLTKSGTPRKR